MNKKNDKQRFDWPEPVSEEKTQAVDAFQKAIKHMLSLNLESPLTHTKEQKDAVNILYKELLFAAFCRDMNKKE